MENPRAVSHPFDDSIMKLPDDATKEPAFARTVESDSVYEGPSHCANDSLCMDEKSANILALHESKRRCGNGRTSNSASKNNSHIAKEEIGLSDLPSHQVSNHQPHSEDLTATTSSPIIISEKDDFTPLHRSTSLDRRLNEAAQFFEAIGESPPQYESDPGRIIEDIEEDDECSYSDDTNSNATEIIVREPGSSLPELDNVSYSCLSSSGLTKASSRRPRWPFDRNIGKQREEQNTELTPKRNDRSSVSFLLLPPVKLKSLASEQLTPFKGITNPPDIIIRGTTRGNYAQLHRKAWLEVSDKKHRYGKNLRLYYREWELKGYPTNRFFDWLDSQGEAEGLPKPELGECPRATLDSDTVLYINDDVVSNGYALEVQRDAKRRALVVDVDGEKVKTGSEGWIFVLRDDVLYGAQKVTSVDGSTKQRFHHSSFFGGKAVAAAGVFVTDDDGILTLLYPHSGHYRPGEADMQRILYFLHKAGVNLDTFNVDIQQLIHINRKDIKNGSKCSKKETLHLTTGKQIAHHLSHKAHCIDVGLFDQIHKLRSLSYNSIREAVKLIDGKIC